MKYTVLTLGCKVNSYESDYIKEQFNENGFSEVSLSDNPDVIVVNTCSVTNQSDAKSRHMIRLARRNAPNAIILACGCSVQNHKDEYRETGADILIGNKDKSRILEYIENFKKTREFTSRYYDLSNTEFETMFLKSENDKTRAFVKIQDGCNNFCAYCIIPYMRGNIRSKDMDVAIEEINSLVKAGHKEIVLTGIHTGSYGVDKNYDLTDLIRKMSEIDGLERIRISSIEITELNDKFLEELKNNPKICNHMHIPLQSGSDKVLKFMNRKYDTEYFYNKIETIRSIRPGISITTDLIVGFPHEDDACFEETMDFIKRIEFTKIHTFPFSLRNGTKAEEMKEYFVDEKVKKERVKRVIELSNALENKYYQKFIGKELDIIVEKSKDGVSGGHSSNYIDIKLDKECEEGSIVKCLVTEVDNLGVNGTILNIE